jgi:hypothetical protein
MSDFNTIITEAVKKEIARKVNEDYAQLHDSFRDFIRKFNVDNTMTKKLREHTVELLVSKEIEFTMLPELEEALFARECDKVVGAILRQESKYL